MKPEEHNYFVVSVSGVNIDMSIVNMEEMSGYCDNRKRLASVVTEKVTYEPLEKLNYSLMFNYSRPKPRIVVTKKKLYFKAYQALAEQYKSGLLIAESDTVSEDISELLCNSDKWRENDVDIIICRHGFKEITEAEMKRANYLRISADPDFDPLLFQQGMGDHFKEKALTILLCQLFANENYNQANAYLDIKNKEYANEGLVDFIDYYEMNKQLAYFVYYDVLNDKVLNISREVMTAFMDSLKDTILPFGSDTIRQFAEKITL